MGRGVFGGGLGASPGLDLQLGPWGAGATTACKGPQEGKNILLMRPFPTFGCWLWKARRKGAGGVCNPPSCHLSEGSHCLSPSGTQLPVETSWRQDRGLLLVLV